MNRTSALILAAASVVAPLPSQGAPASARIIVHAERLHRGVIRPTLFGNFVELLDDVVPGMWSELLNDRSFEGVIPAARWSYYDGSPDICDRQWDPNPDWRRDTNAWRRGRSAKLNANSGLATLTQSGLAVKKGMRYGFSGYFRAAGEIEATVLLKCLLPTGEWMTLASADLPAPSAQWEKRSVQMTSIGETDRAVFELRARGRGALWADKLSLMPGDNQLGWRRDVVAAIRDVRPAIIRWGGSTVDPGQYRWKNAIGDRDRRRSWRNEVWGRNDSNDVGIDEFCQFCELTGAAPLICVSFSDGAQSAADLVAYCNGDPGSRWGSQRARNGHSAPYGVKYWQIGNEISGNDPNYLEQLPEFIRRMKKADPRARIMSSFPTQKLLDQVGRDLAYVCPHHYTPDLGACELDFNRISQMIAHTPGCAHLRVGVTEWNIDSGAWGLGRAKQATLGAALMNARYLNLLMRHSDEVEIACRSNLANSYCGAIIETGASGTGVLRRASFYVMALYSHRFLPAPLWLEQWGDESLDAFACGAEDGKSVTLFAVNSRPEPIRLRFEFAGFPGRLESTRAQTVCDTRQAGQADIMNHWNDPGRIAIVDLPALAGAATLPPLSATAIECEFK